MEILIRKWGSAIVDSVTPEKYKGFLKAILEKLGSAIVDSVTPEKYKGFLKAILEVILSFPVYALC